MPLASGEQVPLFVGMTGVIVIGAVDADPAGKEEPANAMSVRTVGSSATPDQNVFPLLNRSSLLRDSFAIFARLDARFHRMQQAIANRSKKRLRFLLK
jgi:hypothetical protein